MSSPNDYPDDVELGLVPGESSHDDDWTVRCDRCGERIVDEWCGCQADAEPA